MSSYLFTASPLPALIFCKKMSFVHVHSDCESDEHKRDAALKTIFQNLDVEGGGALRLCSWTAVHALRDTHTKFKQRHPCEEHYLRLCRYLKSNAAKGVDWDSFLLFMNELERYPYERVLGMACSSCEVRGLLQHWLGWDEIGCDSQLAESMTSYSFELELSFLRSAKIMPFHREFARTRAYEAELESRAVEVSFNQHQHGASYTGEKGQGSYRHREDHKRNAALKVVFHNLDGQGSGALDLLSWTAFHALRDMTYKLRQRHPCEESYLCLCQYVDRDAADGVDWDSFLLYMNTMERYSDDRVKYMARRSREMRGLLQHWMRWDGIRFETGLADVMTSASLEPEPFLFQGSQTMPLYCETVMTRASEAVLESRAVEALFDREWQGIQTYAGEESGGVLQSLLVLIQTTREARDAQYRGMIEAYLKGGLYQGSLHEQGLKIVNLAVDKLQQRVLRFGNNLVRGMLRQRVPEGFVEKTPEHRKQPFQRPSGFVLSENSNVLGRGIMDLCAYSVCGESGVVGDNAGSCAICNKETAPFFSSLVDYVCCVNPSLGMQVQAAAGCMPAIRFIQKLVQLRDVGELHSTLAYNELHTMWNDVDLADRRVIEDAASLGNGLVEECLCTLLLQDVHIQTTKTFRGLSGGVVDDYIR